MEEYSMLNYKDLSNKELLSTIICERQGEDISTKLLKEFPSLSYLLIDSAEEELLQIKGIGIKRVKQLKAIYELAQRLYTLPISTGQTIKCPQDIANLLMPEMRFLKKEVFKVVLLNTKNRVIEVVETSVGSLSSSIVHPREVFSVAVKRSTSAIRFIHNHPSGDPEPSSEDIETTKRLVSSGDVLGIKVLDHIIIGDGRFISLKERGLI
jgi:DNA repair protein RadC